VILGLNKDKHSMNCKPASGMLSAKYYDKNVLTGIFWCCIAKHLSWAKPKELAMQQWKMLN